MIFDSLDAIDWSAFKTHIYGSAEEIPVEIRQLLSTDPKERLRARESLFGGGQDRGDIYEATAQIIPFALEIIGNEERLGRIELLDYLEAITRNKVFTGGRDYSVREVRNYLNAYDAIERGIPIYLRLLEDGNEKLRAAVIGVLGSLSGSATTILPALRDHFAVETVEKTKIAVINAIARSLREQDTTGIELRKAYAPFFRQIIDNVSSLALRFAAARSALHCSVSQVFGMLPTTEETPLSLSAVLIERYWSLPDNFERQYARLEIVQLLALLPEPTALTELLNHPDTTPDEAHILVRGLLSRFVEMSHLRQYWLYQTQYELKHVKKIYEIYPAFTDLKRYKTHTGWDVLRIVVNADKYWSMPTNLLSIMFNLSDDRETLRAFIEQPD